ncbi:MULTISPECIES: 5-(carboxyamino)imidazole ribonucleotide synthase [unclassified Snodgrassella]|uniref:5-(carboxyamino)imidazole ribonucleotide synthase n=1 Tax=unclassified Snodgrassella TaxID=2625236 RepID=UPI0018DD9910|nr:MULTISPECIES: 5-(carboxyamino)imidazole ribonucleotide synthase [unclassified Snodgrassella]MBI0067637.1 5-(carboxyamino)imidazole ribonucleotide synthase [Snodgrassella sp. M0110]MBI0076399.1 5-(carboxyamino)imidazole ribonucleotide synthase [Snodgrassella sp. M0118]MBI0078937.1 5-(carboxyamino)imidazole ribonucleotide synthase [Snodgrassella sp. M0112]
MSRFSSCILPPAMLGILGGGQLGAMFTVAAKTMGYQVTVLDPDPDAPAAQFADVHLCSDFNNAEALQNMAKCAAVTTEFENVSAESMRWLAQYTVVSPSGDCVAIAQDRQQEKEWIARAGLTTVPYTVISTESDINDSLNALLPGILKTATLGYDGKGQIAVDSLAELQAAFTRLPQVRCVLEKKVDLHAEISVVVARLNNQHTVCFPPAENQHQNGILAYSVVPARLPQPVLKQAENMANQLAQAMDYQGVMAVEMFVAGNEMQLLVNEIAPRPHNSGHYTLDACISDQFQQQVRLMCGLPPAATDLLMPCCMANILGDVWPENGEPNWNAVLNHKTACLHLYGKKQVRPGRKMGHFTVLADNPDQAWQTARNLHLHLQNSAQNSSTASD